MSDAVRYSAEFGGVLITSELGNRPPRASDYRTEAEALGNIAVALSARPANAMQVLVAELVRLGRAESAGISILDADTRRFIWPAVAGEWSHFVGGAMPMDASPCGHVLMTGAVELFRDPHLVYPAATVDPLIREVLLVPLSFEKRIVGTLWAVMHSDRQFDSEDARLLQSLARAAGAAYRIDQISSDYRSIREEVLVRDEAAAHHTVALSGALDALEESEERLRLATDNAEIGFWDVDVMRDVLHWPARTKGMFGIISDRPVSMTDFYDGLHPDDRDQVTAAYLAAADPEQRSLYDVEYRTIGLDDHKLRWVAAKGRGVFDDDGRCVRITGTAIDVTRRKDTEAALQSSEAFNRRVLASSTDCVKVLSLDGKLEFMSEGGQGVMEVEDFDAIDGAFWRDFWPEEEQQKIIGALEAASLGDTARFQGRAATMKGNFRWWDVIVSPILDADGRPERLLSISRDVSALKTVEERLRDLNETLERRVEAAVAERQVFADVVEHSPSSVLVLDKAGRVLAINKANADECETVFGERPKVGDDFFVHIEHLPQQRGVARRFWDRALGGESFTETYAFGGDGFDLRHYEVRFEPLRGRDGANIGGISTAYDVSDRVQAQADLAHAQDALRQSQKMEAMGQLTGGVAHDFNNLLTPIVGTLDMLQTRGVGTERDQRLIAGAILSAERAKTLVQRLLAFARRQPLQAVAVDLTALVLGISDLIESTTGPQIRVAVETVEGLSHAKADPNQLEMALLNLAVNARDAMVDGGVLTIRTTRRSVAGSKPSPLDAGSYVGVIVSDNGLGMDEATRKRAIEPFFSTKGVGQGTGLGLSMVHGLALQLGGMLEIDSTPGEGTHIALWLPETDETLKDIVRPASGDAWVGEGLALLVDDEALARASAAEMLSDLGYEVIEAASAEEALSLVESGLRPRVLITDHLMPGITGTELAQRLLEQTPNLRTLIVSGYAETAGLDPKFRRLLKPYRSAELSESLSHIECGTGEPYGSRADIA